MPGSKVTADMKKEAFARIIFADSKTPKWLAAQEAGYKGNKNTLYSQASKLLNDPKVLAWLGRLTDEADAEAVVDYDGVVKSLAGLKMPTLPDYWENGRLRDPETLSPVERAALKRWKVRHVQSRRRGDENWEVEEQIIEIELWDKVRILELLGKCRHVSAFTNVIQNQGTGEREAWLKKREKQDAVRDQAGLDVIRIESWCRSK